MTTDNTAPSDPAIALRVKALESLLLEKGLIDPQTLDRIVDTYENEIGPQNGAQVGAQAGTDPDHLERLRENATAAIAELGYSGVQGEDMVIVENTPEIHNMVVCTLCSCFPWPTLGLPPVWYKSAPYRSRAAIDPRGVLRDKQGRPRLAASPRSGRRPLDSQVYSMDDLDDTAGLIDAMVAAARAQAIPATVASAARAPGPFEIHPPHP